MELQDIHTIIAEMKYKNQITIRQKESISWGNSLESVQGLVHAHLLRAPHHLRQSRFLPEYDQIVDWMLDTKDKSLRSWFPKAKILRIVAVDYEIVFRPPKSDIAF